jgi:hypothetical protein
MANMAGINLPHVVFTAQDPDKVFEHEWISWGRQDQFILNIAW